MIVQVYRGNHNIITKSLLLNSSFCQEEICFLALFLELLHLEVLHVGDEPIEYKNKSSSAAKLRLQTLTVLQYNNNHIP